MKYKVYISCPFVEITHLRLICIRRKKSRSDRRKEKKNKEKQLPSFLHMFSKVQLLKGLITLKGLMTFGDN